MPVAVWPVCPADLAAGPLTRRHAISPQLRAISLEYTHAELAAATSNFHASKRLGAGCYGAVYRGELKDGSDVAIKAIDLSVLMGKGECPQDAGFDDEVQLLSKFRHPHLVTLLGWGQHGLQRYLVYEFLSGGDVFQRLHKSRTGKMAFPWHERLSVLLDAASGLSHMHNATPKAFHRDIKSANILLDRHHTAKMADFGLACTSRHGATNVTVKSIGGTPGYKCPIYERTGRCTEGSEVYSFGMVMLEVITGLAPSSTDPSAVGGISYPIAEVVAPNRPGALERMRCGDVTADWPPALFHELATTALRCVSSEERQRPFFVDLVRLLKIWVERYPSDLRTSQTPRETHEREIRDLERLKQTQTPQRPKCQDVDGTEYVLELLDSVGCKTEALSWDWRWLPLKRGTGKFNSAAVGRHLQTSIFEAWLPTPQRACISRKAIEVSWDSGEARLTACGSNVVLVDGVAVEQGGQAVLKPGAEITFTYESKVLLRLRFMAFSDSAFTPQWSMERCRRIDPEELERLRLPMLPGIASVAEAVERLNNGSAKCSGGVCLVFSPADCSYVLLFRKGCQAPVLQHQILDSAKTNQVRQAEVRLSWTPPEEAVCELRCIGAEGMTLQELQALPSGLREIPVPLGQSFIKAEALLKDPERSLLRTLQLTADTRSNTLQLNNLCCEGGVAVFVDEEEVATTSCALQHGQVVSLVKKEPPTALLVLQVHWPEQAKTPVAVAPLCKPHASANEEAPETHGFAPVRTPDLACFAQPSLLPPPRRSQGPPPDGEAVLLEIGGTSAKDLPHEERILGPFMLKKEPWIIGRRHQKEFLQRTVKDEFLEFISRDHFAIAYEDQTFLLLALSQNRMWLDQGKVLGVRSLQKDEVVPLRPGDRILLGTAGESSQTCRSGLSLSFSASGWDVPTRK